MREYTLQWTEIKEVRIAAESFEAAREWWVNTPSSEINKQPSCSTFYDNFAISNAAGTDIPDKEWYLFSPRERKAIQNGLDDVADKMLAMKSAQEQPKDNDDG